MTPSEIDTVIYHSPCSDGTAAGWVAWKYFSTTTDRRDITYYPMIIGDKPPLNLEGKNVLICDYSYKKDVLIDLLKKVNKLLIIDHHKSAEKDLKDIDDKYKIFDMNHSGAVLSWMYFFPKKNIPLMLSYIEDRDCWFKKLPNTDEFTSWFYTLPLNFEEYDKYLDDRVLLNMIEVKGKSFHELNKYNISQALENVAIKFSKLKDRYYTIAYVNTTVCKSDIGNEIFKKYPLVDFSVVYSIDDKMDSTLFSLRSTDDRIDVSEIAFSLGGGGHRNASGLKSNNVTSCLPNSIVYNYDGNVLHDDLNKIYFGKLNIQQVFKEKDDLVASQIDISFCQQQKDDLVASQIDMDNIINIVYIPSIHYNLRRQLGDYLLQTYNVQTCRAIQSRLKKYEVEHCDIAVIVSYNSVKDETEFYVVPDKLLTIESYNKILKYIGIFNDDCVLIEKGSSTYLSKEEKKLYYVPTTWRPSKC